MAKRRQTRASHKSVMSHQFSQVPQARIPRSSFNRSHAYKTTLDAGDLVPVYIDEVLPGDTHRLRASFFGRLATPLKPIMDNLFLDSFFFFVPNRLVWDSWQKFNGEQEDPGDSTDYTIPQHQAPVGGWVSGSFFDYAGLPVGVDNISVSALPNRAYTLIYNEWFRDQNLVNSATLDTGDSDVVATGPLRKRGKRHDYFTSALPWPQKGPASIVSLGGQAPINYDGLSGSEPQVYATNYSEERSLERNIGTDNVILSGSSGNIDDLPLYADLSNATAITINQLRESFQIQKLLERDARGGTRYTEIVRSHFGVISPDARLQRPEFLGGGTSMVNINPVAQVSATDENVSPQGNLAAYGTVSGYNHGFTKSFTEHGFIIGIVNVRADLTYQQGINRLWSRTGRYDFYWPALAHLGEQGILNKEIYAQGTPADDDVFGYIPRYDEYRFKQSHVTGLFRSNIAGSLDVWHLAQDFGSLPQLGTTFITENPPIDRVIAVPSEPHFLLDCWFSLRSVRPMPTYAVPGLIDHF